MLIPARLCVGLLALLAIGSCTSDTVAENETLGEVRITSATGSPPGILLTVAAHLTVQVTVVDNAGRSVDPQPPLQFSTGNAQVAVVTAAGLLTGNAPGSTSLRAEAAGSPQYRPASVSVTVVQVAGSNR